MDASPDPTATATGSTAWSRTLPAPVRRFLRTETGSAAILLAGTLAALVWVNVDGSSYASVWHTELSVRIGSAGITQDLRGWVNQGLMTFFFFVVGLEVRREFDIGELRERRRLALPLLAGVGGMVLAVALFLAVNAGRPSAGGWGVAMSTDTAFALGALSLVGPRFPDRLRTFLLTVVVVDDVIALLVIATVYAGHLDLGALAVGLAFYGLGLVGIRLKVRSGLVYLLLGMASWVALRASGVDPVVIGLALGVVAFASPPGRDELERATDLFRSFREQPTSGLARSARAGLKEAVAPNERLQSLYHPWTSYVIVPLFALANAGIAIDGGFLSSAYGSAVTLGIIVGYAVGKPLGVGLTALAVTRLSRGRLRPPVGWAAVAGGGAVTGIGFTVSLLIASLAFRGRALAEAKLGVLSAAVLATLLGALVFRVAARLPRSRRLRAILGTTQTPVDLMPPVDPQRDHIRGPGDAPVTLVEYGDLECPYCGQAEPVVRELLIEEGDVRYVWRHLPLTDVHPRAQLAAEATEAAGLQGAFWELHDVLLDHQDELRPADLVAHAERLGLDAKRFARDLRRHVGAGRVAEDVDAAGLSGVSGTPTFFVNGRRHRGAYDIATLEATIRVARARAAVSE